MPALPLHIVKEAWKVSVGQAADEPVQFSAISKLVSIMIKCITSLAMYDFVFFASLRCNAFAGYHMFQHWLCKELLSC